MYYVKHAAVCNELNSFYLNFYYDSRHEFGVALVCMGVDHGCHIRKTGVNGINMCCDERNATMTTKNRKNRIKSDLRRTCISMS